MKKGPETNIHMNLQNVTLEKMPKIKTSSYDGIQG